MMMITCEIVLKGGPEAGHKQLTTHGGRPVIILARWSTADGDDDDDDDDDDHDDGDNDGDNDDDDDHYDDHDDDDGDGNGDW